MNVEKMSVLTAVGSRHDQRCGVGTFARADFRSLEKCFARAQLLEPAAGGSYPDCALVEKPDVILYHTPTLHDRVRPWNILTSAIKLRRAFPKALFIPVVHEFSEAPRHWKLRVLALLRMGLVHGVIVHTDIDFAALSRWHRRVVKLPQGPSLFMPELFAGGNLKARAVTLQGLREKARASLPQGISLKDGEKLLLHPGLLVPGKGVNFLGRLAPYIAGNARLVVMGGLGPKERDRAYARQTIDELRRRVQSLSFIESPDDDVYAQLLLAADLIVLPYDAGVSERRSSFFSAIACGGNVWTTSGLFTPPLELERSGVHVVPADRWAAGDSSALESIANALLEPELKIAERRLQNLVWSDDRAWEKRAEKLQSFISILR